MLRTSDTYSERSGHNIRFSDLQQKFEEVAALALLMEMERHVGLNSALLAGVDPECRLQVAIALMSGGRQ